MIIFTPGNPLLRKHSSHISISEDMSTLHFKWLKKQYSESDISEQYIGSKFFSKNIISSTLLL